MPCKYLDNSGNPCPFFSSEKRNDTRIPLECGPANQGALFGEPTIFARNNFIHKSYLAALFVLNNQACLCDRQNLVHANFIGFNRGLDDVRVCEAVKLT